jgi:hypothetical protein
LWGGVGGGGEGLFNLQSPDFRGDSVAMGPNHSKILLVKRAFQLLGVGGRVATA